MEFRILGPLEVSTADGPLSLGGKRQRLVLAHLMIRSNEVVPTDVLIDEVWGDEPPDSVRSTLQGYVSHLRRVLGDRLEGRAPGYILGIEEGELDAAVFERRLREAKSSSASAPAEAAAAFADALSLWRGPAFADLADESSLRGEIARLEELRLAATEHRIAAEIAIGGHSTVVSELEGLTVRYPLRERMWANLMLARYRLGRQAEALSTYERARQVLAEELGVEPSADLQRLHEQILRRDAALGPSEAGKQRVRPSRVDLQPGTEFAGYRISRTLGRGGMSVVYLAEHDWLQRKVALKVLAPQLAEDERFRERFVRESRLAASLDHPNVIPIYEAGGSGGDLFIAMRYVEGTDLRGLLHDGGALEPDRALGLLRQVAAALDAAHEQGLVHRDVKPGNVLLAQPRGSGPDVHVYLSDFGLTKRSASESGVTGTGQFVGTLDYAAPEQFQGGVPDARTDVYSLGCVLFECLTGRPPFQAENDASLMYAHLQLPPPDVTSERPDLPAAIDAVVTRAMAKAPADRQQSAGALADDAAEALGLGTVGGGKDGPPERSIARRLVPVLAVVIALGAGILVSSLLRSDSPQAQDLDTTTPAATPSPTVPPTFRTVERALEPEEERLLGYIPEDLSAECLPLDRDQPIHQELAALACRTDDVEVLYELFQTRDAMDAAFQLKANIERAPDGECATDTLAVTPYTIGGEPAGRVLCYTHEIYGRSAHASFIEWTDENASIYAQAVRNDLGDLSLYEWWLSSAGPFVAPEGEIMVAKDRPKVAGAPPPQNGSYLASPPGGCAGLEGQTCAMHIVEGTYELWFTDGREEVGSVYLQKPRAIVFAPESGNYCFEEPRSPRPASYGWSVAEETVSFERASGGRCAGPQKLTAQAWTRAPNGLIALEADEEIEVMNAGGFGVDRPTEGGTTDPNFSPDWSPDGTELVFAGAAEGYALYLMDTDGTGTVPLVDRPGDEAHPSWSPDGGQIAFAYDDLGETNFRSSVVVVNADGSGWTELATLRTLSVYRPTWSPDGRRIAFTAFNANGHRLYVMNADGTGLSEIHREPRSVIRAPMSWTPDGRRIVFWGSGSDGEALLSMRPDGTDIRGFGEPFPLWRGTGGGLMLDWSPDGRWIVLAGVPEFRFRTGTMSAVYLMRSDGSEIFAIKANGTEASWRPTAG